MALLAGTVTVNPDLTSTGNGLASEMYGALKTLFFGPTDGTHAAQLLALEGLAKMANALAPVIVAHIVTHGVVAVPATGILAPNGACTGAASGTIS